MTYIVYLVKTINNMKVKLLSSGQYVIKFDQNGNEKCVLSE